MTSISAKAIQVASGLIEGFEAFRSRPYKDPGGVWTYGFGATSDIHGNKVTAATPSISEADARSLMQSVVAKLADKLEAMVSAPLTDDQAAALLSMQYNIGSGALSRSTLIRDFNAGDTQLAADQFGEWVYQTIGGVKTRLSDLVRRRATERSLFLGQVPGTAAEAPPPPVVAAQVTADDLNAEQLQELHA